MIKHDDSLYPLHAYNQLTDLERMQLRKAAVDETERRYFTYAGVVFDVYDFTDHIDDMWKGDGMVAIHRYNRNNVMIGFVAKVRAA
jgi:hypothetical protein